jgi:hypothetical protein
MDTAHSSLARAATLSQAGTIAPVTTALTGLAGTRARLPGSTSSSESLTVPKEALNTNGAQRLKLAKGCNAEGGRSPEILPS